MGSRPVAPRPAPLLDGSTSRTVLLLAIIIATGLLNWHGSVDGQATVALLSLIGGGILHASGARQGSQATSNPPPE